MNIGKKKEGIYFTILLCINQALVCYVNSFMFKQICFFGSSRIMLMISNFAEVINNIVRSLSIFFLHNKDDKSIFKLNLINIILLAFMFMIYSYAIYDDFNLKLCIFAWIGNRICNSIVATCRDLLIYKLNHEGYNLNVPIIKTFKSFGNLINLLIFIIFPASYFCFKIIYFYIICCMIGCFINIVISILMYYVNLDMSNEPKSKINNFNWHVINMIFKLFCITFFLNLAQVDDSIVYYQISDNNLAFILKQCIGQVGFGLLYALFFSNSYIILLATPLVNLIFHICSIYKIYYVGAIVFGLQFMLKNTSYILFSLFFAEYNFWYPIICILSDTISILFSNFIFLTIDKIFGIEIAHVIFSILGIISLLFGIIIYMKSIYYNGFKVKDNIVKNNDRK